MKKVDLIKGQMIRDHVEFHLGDRWIEWRLQQGNYPKHGEEGWTEAFREVIDTLPDKFDWSIDFKNEQMVMFWGDGNKETIPLEFFYDDKDQQPDLTLLWHENYWDGPLSGVAIYNGEYVWFELKDEDETGDRVFSLHRMSNFIRDEVLLRHRNFQENVGYHCDHDPAVYKPYDCSDQKKMRLFYDRPKLRLNPEAGEKIGEFHWFQFKNWGRPV